jgi:hypothetical protein
LSLSVRLYQARAEERAQTQRAAVTELAISKVKNRNNQVISNKGNNNQNKNNNTVIHGFGQENIFHLLDKSLLDIVYSAYGFACDKRVILLGALWRCSNHIIFSEAQYTNLLYPISDHRLQDSPTADLCNFFCFMDVKGKHVLGTFFWFRNVGKFFRQLLQLLWLEYCHFQARLERRMRREETALASSRLGSIGVQRVIPPPWPCIHPLRP